MKLKFPIRVTNPRTEEPEEWELECWRENDQPLLNVVRREGETHEFVDFVTLYGLDGSQVDEWYKMAAEAYM
jgi:hypothetical protein